MFFILSIHDRQKSLDFQQLLTCAHCGHSGTLELYYIETCFSLFFIPLFKWNRRYYARMSCCGATTPLDPESLEKIKNRQWHDLNFDELFTTMPHQPTGRCPQCNTPIETTYDFCPRCGGKIK